MNTQPVVAARAPAKMALETGKDYWFCTCGRSATQPFCNGSHKGTGFAPKKFTAEKSGDAWLCQCKNSKNQPYCDGTHKSLAT
jgi:CDGSH-type Zn-finger protein